MNYQLQIQRSAQKSLAKIAQPFQRKIIEQIRHLATDPRPNGCKKLSGRSGWRVRVGNYRVIYEIEDDKLIVLVIQVGHRSQIYRDEN